MLKITWLFIWFFISIPLTHADVSGESLEPSSGLSLEQFEKELHFEDIYIAFVQPSLISPMSYFGHTFMVFKKNNSWDFSKTFSFTAVIPEKISNNDLLFSGATGKLKGRYVIGNLHEFKHAYLKKEQRGISLHKLNLTENEKKILVSSAYKLYSQTFDYHFFEQNCTTELITFLAEIRPSLLKKLQALAIKEPASTLNLLMSEGLIDKNNSFYPPKITYVFDTYLKLDNASRLLVNSYLDDVTPSKNYAEEDDDIKESLINTSSLLFNFFNSPPVLYKEFQQLTYTNAIEGVTPLKTTSSYTEPTRISFGVKQVDNKTFGSIGFMISHLERFEERFSFVNESTLKTFDTSIKLDKDKVEIDKIDLFELAAYNKSFGEVFIPSWRIYAGYNDKYNYDKHSIMSEIGYGLSFGTKDLLFSFMPQIRLDLNQGTITSQLNGLASYWYGKTNISYNFVGNITRHKGENNIHQLKLNIPVEHNASITISGNVSQSEYEVRFNRRFAL